MTKEVTRLDNLIFLMSYWHVEIVRRRYPIIRFFRNCASLGVLVAISSAPLHAAEIWYFPMYRGRPKPCALRTEQSIDELWVKLEKETDATWSIPKDMSMLPGVVLQSAKLNKEYSLYRSREACEYERARMELILSGDPKLIEEYKRSQTPEKTRAALAPKSILNKQEWLDGFAGCTDARLAAGNVIKGKVNATIAFCECVATNVAEIIPSTNDAELNATNKAELNAKFPLIMEKCLADSVKSNQ
jgi:hypothetical protein